MTFTETWKQWRETEGLRLRTGLRPICQPPPAVSKNNPSLNCYKGPLGWWTAEESRGAVVPDLLTVI
jgi:hypothetical protein